VHAPLIVFCARELALLRRTLHRASVPRRHLLLLLAQQPLHDAVLVEHVARLEGQRDLHGGAGGGGGSGGGGSGGGRTFASIYRDIYPGRVGSYLLVVRANSATLSHSTPGGAQPNALYVGGVIYCHSHRHPAKFCDVMYKGKYGAVIG